MSPLGANAIAIGFLSPPASCVWANPGAMLGLTLSVVVADAVKVEEDSDPDTVAVSDSVDPAVAVTAPVIVTDHTCPAPRLAAVHVTCGDE